LLGNVHETAKINPLALERDANQPEFTKPVWSYVDSAASDARITSGQDKMTEVDPVLDTIEARYRIPREVLTAIWGLETSYGRILGKHEIIDSLSTFAFEGRRKSFGEQQLYALLDLLAAGEVRKEQLVGAWAGAMGMTQFIPTTFRDYAVDLDGNGNKDLWTDPGDALASAANYISRSGWQAGEPVMTEVKLPRKPGIQQDWPRGDALLSFEDKKSMQRKLTALGYSTGGVDGRVGPNTRRAIRAWQAANGLTADGYMEQRLFKRLMAQ